MHTENWRRTDLLGENLMMRQNPPVQHFLLVLEYAAPFANVRHVPIGRPVPRRRSLVVVAFLFPVFLARLLPKGTQFGLFRRFFFRRIGVVGTDGRRV